MKSLTEQLSTYKSVHLNEKNIWTHFIGIPLIIWSIALLLATIGFSIETSDSVLSINLATIVAVAVLCYYLVLSRALAVLALLLFGPLIYSAIYVAEVEYHYMIALMTFIIGWIFQFVGHAFEKAKPAFVDDINQLLIGPLFLLAELYFLVGFLPTLNKAVTEQALKKRKIFDQQGSVAS